MTETRPLTDDEVRARLAHRFTPKLVRTERWDLVFTIVVVVPLLASTAGRDFHLSRSGMVLAMGLLSLVVAAVRWPRLRVRGPAAFSEAETANAREAARSCNACGAVVFPFEPKCLSCGSRRHQLYARPEFLPLAIFALVALGLLFGSLQ